MRLESPAYRDGEPIPTRFAAVNVAGGTGASVPLAWGDAPPSTRSYALATIDRHPVAHGWVHWLVTELPAETHALDEGSSLSPRMPRDAVEHPNSGGGIGYGGPQPPAGSGVHDYATSIYALDVPHLDVGRNASWDQIRVAMSGHVLDSATLVGRLGR
jgi:hypothetical protein